MLANQARRFGETLVDRHVLSRDDLEQAIEESERTKQPLPAVLLRLGLVGSKDLTAALAEQIGVRFIDFLETPIHQDAPETLLGRARAPVRRGAGRLRGPQARRRVRRAADDDALDRGRCRDRLRDHPRGRRPRRAHARDRHDLRRRPTATRPSSARTSSVGDERSTTSCTSTTCSSSSSSGAAPTCTSRRARRRSSACTASCARSPSCPILNGSQIRQMVYSILTQKQREKFENELELDTLVRAAGQGPLPRQRLPAARLRRLRDAGDPVRDRRLRQARRAAPRCRRWPTCRVASCSSPVRPVRASRRRSRRSIDIVNRERAVHIMTVEDPIEFLHHAQALARSTSARWGRTRTPSPTRSSTCCARTPTSSSSVRCVTSRRSRPR